MLIEKFYCVNNMAGRLLLRPDDFYDGPLSILWHNNGLFGLIQAERVRNDLNSFNDLKKTKDHSDIEGIIYTWDDTIRVKKLI